MEDSDSVKEVTFDEAVAMSAGGRPRMVWLGREPADRIAGMLGLQAGSIIGIDAERILHSGADALGEVRGSVLICYHGRTSKMVASFLKKSHGIEAYSMKGGVTSVVGEIF